MNPITGQFSSIYVPTFEMKIEGKPLRPDEAKRIIQISVTEHMDPPNQFSFQMYDPGQEFIDKEKGKFKEGAFIEIRLGYIDNVKDMIVGKISTITADFPGSGYPTIQVDGFDLMHDLTYGKWYEKYDDKDSDIVKKIAKKYKMEVEIPEKGTSTRTEERTQNHISDLDFLKELARLNGYCIWMKGKTLHFDEKKPAPSIIPLQWGKNLISFSPRLSKPGQVKAIEVRGWDPGQKQTFSAREERSDEDSNLSIGKLNLQSSSKIVYYNELVSNEAEARTLAKAILSEKKQNIVTGSGTCIGEPRMHTGTILQLSKVGHFSGTYVVTGVTHTVGGNGYQTTFQLNGGSGTADLGSHSGSARDQALSGILVGEVDDNKDAKMGIIKVKLPGLSDKQIVHKARLATIMAGDNQGTFFLPAKKDEVLVAFDNRNQSYVIGSLWNGKQVIPDTNDNGENNLRFIKSRSGHVLCFDDTKNKEKIEIFDKEKKNIITIDTANNTITIKSTDKDINIEALNGTIKLDAKKIILSSEQEASIEAKGGLTLNGKPKDVIITGTNVKIN